MKITLFKNIPYGYESAVIGDNFKPYTTDEYIQISETIEVDFNMISDVDMVNAEIAVIDNAIQKTLANTEVKVNELKQRKQELLAIGCDDE